MAIIESSARNKSTKPASLVGSYAPVGAAVGAAGWGGLNSISQTTIPYAVPLGGIFGTLAGVLTGIIGDRYFSKTSPAPLQQVTSMFDDCARRVEEKVPNGVTVPRLSAEQMHRVDEALKSRSSNESMLATVQAACTGGKAQLSLTLAPMHDDLSKARSPIKGPRKAWEDLKAEGCNKLFSEVLNDRRMKFHAINYDPSAAKSRKQSITPGATGSDWTTARADSESAGLIRRRSSASKRGSLSRQGVTDTPTPKALAPRSSFSKAADVKVYMSPTLAAQRHLGFDAITENALKKIVQDLRAGAVPNKIHSETNEYIFDIYMGEGSGRGKWRLMVGGSKETEFVMGDIRDYHLQKGERLWGDIKHIEGEPIPIDAGDVTAEVGELQTRLSISQGKAWGNTSHVFTINNVLYAQVDGYDNLFRVSGSKGEYALRNPDGSQHNKSLFLIPGQDGFTVQRMGLLGGHGASKGASKHDAGTLAAQFNDVRYRDLKMLDTGQVPMREVAIRVMPALMLEMAQTSAQPVTLRLAEQQHWRYTVVEGEVSLQVIRLPHEGDLLLDLHKVPGQCTISLVKATDGKRVKLDERVAKQFVEAFSAGYWSVTRDHVTENVSINDAAATRLAEATPEQMQADYQQFLEHDRRIGIQQRFSWNLRQAKVADYEGIHLFDEAYRQLLDDTLGAPDALVDALDGMGTAALPLVSEKILDMVGNGRSTRLREEMQKVIQRHIEVLGALVAGGKMTLEQVQAALGGRNGRSLEGLINSSRCDESLKWALKAITGAAQGIPQMGDAMLEAIYGPEMFTPVISAEDYLAYTTPDPADPRLDKRYCDELKKEQARLCEQFNRKVAAAVLEKMHLDLDRQFGSPKVKDQIPNRALAVARAVEQSLKDHKVNQQSGEAWAPIFATSTVAKPSQEPFSLGTTYKSQAVGLFDAVKTMGDQLAYEKSRDKTAVAEASPQRESKSTYKPVSDMERPLTLPSVPTSPIGSPYRTSRALLRKASEHAPPVARDKIEAPKETRQRLAQYESSEGVKTMVYDE
jgi:hypothetical protein